MTRVRLIASLACLAGSLLIATPAPALAQSSATPAAPKLTAEARMQGPIPIRLLAEAEEFAVDKPGWRVLPYRENYFASTFAISFLSRMACLSAPEQLPVGEPAVASQKINIPRAGVFHVLARYEQPLDFSAEFTLEVEQDGKVVYSKPFGRLSDPKIWALNMHKRVPMERYWWGGVDNIVWQEVETVMLKAGDATLRLIAAAQLDGEKPRVNAARRNVDIVCLTNDEAGMASQKKTRYLEYDGWLTQWGDVYIRITNPAENNSPCAPKLGPCEQHSPHDVHVRDWSTTSVYKQGRVDPLIRYQYVGPHIGAVDRELLAPQVDSLSVPAVVPVEMMLAPGEASGWVPMGKILDSLNYCVWAPYPNFRFQSGNSVGLDLEFAIPDGQGGLKTIRNVRVNDDLLYIPANLRKNPNIRTRLETLTALTEFVEKLPSRGPAPKRFPVFGILDFSGAKLDEGPVGEKANQLALALGSNMLVATPGSWALKLGVTPARTKILTHFNSTDAIKRAIDAAVKEQTDGLIRVVSFGDELNIQPARPLRGAEEIFNNKYAQFLRDQGVANVPQGIRVTDDDRDPWFYYSQLYRLMGGIENTAKLTQQVHEAFNGQVLAGANIAPLANFMVTEKDFVRPFKYKGMSVAWGEDYTWQAPEFSTQVTGYLVSGFRAGAKYHDTPIMMYIMPHSPGNTPATFRRSFYTAVAHGTRMVNYFSATPLSVGGTENYVDTDDLPMWKAIHDTTHDAGRFEDYVLDGRPEKAKVALLLSSVDEVITGDSNMQGGIHNLERKGIYYALRHAQVPVDMLSEDDLLDGQSDEYRVIYVTQQYLAGKTLRALKQFVEKGGTVIGLCGGGMYDEFQRVNKEAADFWGAEGETIIKDEKLKMILPKQDLPRYKVADTVNFSGASGTEPRNVPVVAWRQRLTLPENAGERGTHVIATFSDGKPAAIERRVGAGTVALFAFLPGTAYMKSGLPLRPVDRTCTDEGYAHFCPIDMDANLRAAIVDRYLPEGFRRNVIVAQPAIETPPPLVREADLKNEALVNTQKSIVETTRILTRGKDGRLSRMAVPMINFTNTPIEKLSVSIGVESAPVSIRSVERGKLDFDVKNGVVTLTLPLDVADMLLIDF